MKMHCWCLHARTPQDWLDGRWNARKWSSKIRSLDKCAGLQCTRKSEHKNIICCCKRPTKHQGWHLTKNSMNAPFLFNPLNACFRRTHLQLPPWRTTALAVQAVVERKIVNSGWISQKRVHVKTQSLREPLETLDVDARCWRKPSKHVCIYIYRQISKYGCTIGSEH